MRVRVRNELHSIEGGRCVCVCLYVLSCLVWFFIVESVPASLSVTYHWLTKFVVFLFIFCVCSHSEPCVCLCGGVGLCFFYYNFGVHVCSTETDLNKSECQTNKKSALCNHPNRLKEEISRNHCRLAVDRNHFRLHNFVIGYRLIPFQPN